MDYVKSFRDLEVYKLAKQLAREIFEITKSFPKEERYSLTDQIRKSSRSVDAQIAEAWARRNYENHFVSKLSDGDGEQLETQHWLDSSYECQYITREAASGLVQRYEEVGKMLQSMMDKAHLFCRSRKKR